METNRLTTNIAEMVRLLGFETVNVCTLTESEVMEKITASDLRLKYITENFTPKITSYLTGQNYFNHEKWRQMDHHKNMDCVKTQKTTGQILVQASAISIDLSHSRTDSG